jgi:hypothetical protein
MRLRDYWLLYDSQKDRRDTPIAQRLEEENAFYAGAAVMLTILEADLAAYRRIMMERAP